MGSKFSSGSATRLHRSPGCLVAGANGPLDAGGQARVGPVAGDEEVAELRARPGPKPGRLGRGRKGCALLADGRQNRTGTVKRLTVLDVKVPEAV